MDISRLHSFIKDEYKEKFETFKEELLKYNKMYNLTAICDEEGIYYKHFLDSIVPYEHFEKGANVVEIGSGGGFPSIPLKIIREDLSFTLIESTGKKCAYLENVVEKLNLSQVCIKNIRAEEGAKDKNMREKFDICTARAVAQLNTLCEYCLPYVAVGGKFIAYKGECDEEIERAKNAVKILGGEIEKVENYELENCGKRTLIVIRKVAHTPPSYPRGQGRERKNPL